MRRFAPRPYRASGPVPSDYKPNFTAAKPSIWCMVACDSQEQQVERRGTFQEMEDALARLVRIYTGAGWEQLSVSKHYAHLLNGRSHMRWFLAPEGKE